MKTERELLEDILVAHVLLMSHAINTEKEAKGTHRAFGDYTKEAAAEIKKNKAKIIELLNS